MQKEMFFGECVRIGALDPKSSLFIEVKEQYKVLEKYYHDLNFDGELGNLVALTCRLNDCNKSAIEIVDELKGKIKEKKEYIYYLYQCRKALFNLKPIINNEYETKTNGCWIITLSHDNLFKNQKPNDFIECIKVDKEVILN